MDLVLPEALPRNDPSGAVTRRQETWTDTAIKLRICSWPRNAGQPGMKVKWEWRVAPRLWDAILDPDVLRSLNNSETAIRIGESEYQIHEKDLTLRGDGPCSGSGFVPSVCARWGSVHARSCGRLPASVVSRWRTGRACGA